MNIRLADECDLKAVYALNSNDNPHPWAEHHFQAACAQGNLYILEENQQIIAFAVWQKVLDEAELHLIVCKENYRGQNRAGSLIGDFVARNKEIKHIFLEVRENNSSAIKCYEKQGFIQTGRRKNYYMLPIEDALIMEKSC